MDRDEIFVQVFNAKMNPVGDPVIANTHVFGEQSEPVVTALDGGGFVVAWQSINADGDFLLATAARVFCPCHPAGTGNRKARSGWWKNLSEKNPSPTPPSRSQIVEGPPNAPPKRVLIW